MAEERDLKQARVVYKSLCEMLYDRQWHYEKDEEGLSIKCSAQGDDLPMEIIIEVDAERKLISLLSQMPFGIAENRRTALAVAVSQANNGMIDGSFDYDYLSGNIYFRLTSSYRESLIGKELLNYMLMCACYTIDEYNDKFLMVAKNNMSIEEILDFVK
ncbi:MAG: YbjN domain-containing protein [Clostridiales bacterium]|nr:YbjN domain-containing protein [Clostridiales bacterium]